MPLWSVSKIGELLIFSKIFHITLPEIAKVCKNIFLAHLNFLVYTSSIKYFLDTFLRDWNEVTLTVICFFFRSILKYLAKNSRCWSWSPISQYNSKIFLSWALLIFSKHFILHFWEYGGPIFLASIFRPFLLRCSSYSSI